MDAAAWLKHKDLEYRDGILFIGDVPASSLAEKFGTPLYVINENLIRKRYRDLVEVLKGYYDKIRIHYAMKANSNLAVLKILKEEGAGLDCVSTGEVYLGLKAGFDPDKIIYTGNYFSNAELQDAFEQGIMINLDAISHIKRMAKIAQSAKKDLPLISFRINPEFGGGHHKHTFTAGKDIKFGILEDQVVEAYELAKQAGFTRFGVHMHIGSGILDISRFEKAAEKYFSIIQLVREKLGIIFEFIDFGGGLGIPYHIGEDPIPLEDYAGLLMGFFKNKIKELEFGEPTFIIEPGRYLACEASQVLVQVTTMKPTTYKNFIGVDAGFNTLVRPTMYGSWHEIIPVKKTGAETIKADIVGQICESGDVLGRDREIEKPEEGDYLAILDAGAYGFSMCSEYNSRPRPAEILVNGTNSWVVRRRETLEDLDRLQQVPDHLQ